MAEMSYLDQKQAEMDYARNRAAEAARQEYENAQRAKMAQVMNQGTPGLAQSVAQPYVSGISQEDAYKLALAKQVAANNYNRDLEGMKAAPVTNGKIDPSYWDMAQRASDYEIANGLAGKAAR